ncbi:sensor histidine kinase [Pseudonocardia sp. RS11V-5]|uniref:sensor histidine kinase n=1 Tax=Pseudonocardia terrae TaxID=2905831 RepID=UPI001E61070D|nr:sensor histidine kinase [Pseudonocardia terrae]MCE3556346.1 sensor histidine kinase [Pseudonocardia terrae]
MRGTARVRTRIVALSVAIAAIAVTLFGVPLALGLARYEVDDEGVTLQRLADLTAAAVLTDLAHDRVPAVLPGSGTPGTTLGLYDDDDLLVAGDGSPTGDVHVGAVLGGAAPRIVRIGDDVVTVVPVRGEHDVIGAVRASRPVSVVYAALVPIWLGMLGLAALVLVAAWAIARRQAGRLAHPLEDLAVLAGRLGDGDFSVRPRRAGLAEVDALGAAFASTAARLDALLARERAFSAEASHQLRTPLAALRLRLENARADTRPGAELGPALDAAVAETDRLTRTVEELLALARSRDGAGRAPVDLHAVLDEVAETYRPRLVAEGRELELDLDGIGDGHPDCGEPAVVGSRAAIGQVLAVLLDNALRHGEGAVRVGLRDVGDAVAVDVGDEGPGFANGRPERDGGAPGPETPGEGLGLGLPLATRLAEDQGGRLVVSRESPPVMTLFLPLDDGGGAASGDGASGAGGHAD